MIDVVSTRCQEPVWCSYFSAAAMDGSGGIGSGQRRAVRIIFLDFYVVSVISSVR